MKLPLAWLFAAGALALGLPAHAADSEALVDFGKLDAPARGDFVEVRVQKNLLRLAARLAERHEPDAAALLRGLELVRVNVVGLDDGNRASVTQRAGDLATRLEGRGWEKVVAVQQAGEENVNVYLKLRGDEAIEGLVVTVLGGRGEGVFVNVVGDIRADQLAKLGEKLNLPPLQRAAAAVAGAAEVQTAPATPATPATPDVP